MTLIYFVLSAKQALKCKHALKLSKWDKEAQAPLMFSLQTELIKAFTGSRSALLRLFVPTRMQVLLE